MAIWPFGRKSKKASSADEPAAAMPPSKSHTAPDITRRDNGQPSDLEIPALRHRSSRRDTQKRPRSTSRKLSKANAPSIRNSERIETVPPIPALPQERRKELNEKAGANKSNQLPSSVPPQDRGDVPSYYFQNPASASSLQPEKFNVIQEPPALQGKRSANDEGILRRKSSKRKAEDHARLQEIKSMTAPIPIPKRPTSYQNSPLVRDNKQFPGGLNRNLERPLSEISLPIAESMQSQMSVSSEHAFKVSTLDALSPRPTIRYSGNPRSPAGSTGPSRTSTRKDKQPVIPEENLHRKRIDDLADDMDAGSIRELMERDKRRHEKRRKSENERLARRLERRAARQKEKEALAGGSQGEANERDKDVSDSVRTPAPVEATPDSAAGPSSLERPRTPESWLHDASRQQTPEANPFQDPKGTSTSHFEEATPTDDREVPVLETAKAVHMSSPNLTPSTSPIRHVHEPSNLSQLSELAASITPEPPERLDLDKRRDSDTSNRFSTNWKSIFRRSDTRAKRDSADRGRATPSEFSNTSRESVARQMPPSAFERISKARAGTPKRTQSRFREDLPELPISPPDSRMQSPEVGNNSPLPAVPGSRGTDVVDVVDDGKRLSDIHPAYREEVALSRQASLRAKSPEVGTAANLSESLATVDAEGSWLTGKPVKRLSQQQQLPRENQSSPQPMEEFEGSDEDDGQGTPPAAKYMGSIIPPREDRPNVPQRKRPFMAQGPSLGGDEDDDESTLHPAPIGTTDEEGTWHGNIGKNPTIVRPGPGPRVKSREGLLNDFRAEEDSPDSSPTADSPDSPEGLSIQRATSVDFGKGHARHISAGSARLLNLPPRSSQEMKRLSSASGERSPLSVGVQNSPKLPETTSDDVD